MNSESSAGSPDVSTCFVNGRQSTAIGFMGIEPQKPTLGAAIGSDGDCLTPVMLYAGIDEANRDFQFSLPPVPFRLMNDSTGVVWQESLLHF